MKNTYRLLMKTVTNETYLKLMLSTLKELHELPSDLVFFTQRNED